MKKCIGTYSDQEQDSEVGLYNFNARLYDPAIGIFISPDSIVQDPYDPQTLNRYAYCRNNPLIYTDPSGHIFGLGIVESIVFGAIVGGITSAATDGDIGMGMLTGAIGGAFFFGAGELALSGVNSVVAHAGAGALSGGVNSAITGNDIGLGMLTGGISGGFGEFGGGLLSEHGFNSFGEQLVGRSIIGGISGGISAEIYGGSFYSGFAYGMQTGAIGYLSNHMAHEIWYGIKTAVVQGAKAGTYSVKEAAKAINDIDENGHPLAKTALGVAKASLELPLAAAGGGYAAARIGLRLFARGGRAWHYGVEYGSKLNIAHIGRHPRFGVHMAFGNVGPMKANLHIYFQRSLPFVRIWKP